MSEQPGEMPNKATETEATNQQQQAQTETASVSRAEFEAIQKALKAANKEAAERRKQLDAYEAEKKTAEEAQLSEAEKLKKQLLEAQDSIKRISEQSHERAIRAEIVSKAALMGFNDPGDAIALLDKSKIDTDENGEITGVEDALQALAKAKPYMLKTNRVNPGATNPGSNAREPNQEAQTRNWVYGTGVDIFDATQARKLGGGVIWPDANHKE